MLRVIPLPSSHGTPSSAVNARLLLPLGLAYPATVPCFTPLLNPTRCRGPWLRDVPLWGSICPGERRAAPVGWQSWPARRSKEAYTEFDTAVTQTIEGLEVMSSHLKTTAGKFRGAGQTSTIQVTRP